MDESEQRKQGILIRLIKAASIVFVAAVLSGLLYGYTDYWQQFTERSRLKREIARERLEEDSLPRANQRFLIGGGVGAALGLAYVVRCARRREDV